MSPEECDRIELSDIDDEADDLLGGSSLVAGLVGRAAVKKVHGEWVRPSISMVPIRIDIIQRGRLAARR